ncbi:formyltransferase family protein [Temperatibacter marinus]
MPFLGNMTMLDFLLTRLSKLANVQEVVLTTGKDPANDPIEKISNNHTIQCFRGDEEDVLSRFLKAAIATDAETIVRVCADNPLTDPRLIDELITFYHSRNDIDHLATFDQPSLPYGVGCAIFSLEALKLTDKSCGLNDPSREHIEPFMLQSMAIKTFHYIAKTQCHFPALRVTVDEKRDFDFVQPLADALVRRFGLDFITEELVNLVSAPKIALFANGTLGLKGAQFLKSIQANIAVLVLHPKSTATDREEIIETLNLSPSSVIDYSEIKEKGIEFFEDNGCDIALSLWSSYIFKSDLIKKFPLGVYNLHNSLLPALGGSGANIWTFLLNLKESGASLHRVTAQIDQGPIIDQRAFPVLKDDTGGSLYDKQQAMMLALLKENWKDLCIGNYSYKISTEEVSYFKKSERDEQKCIDLAQNLSVNEILNIIRGYQFNDTDSAYFVDENGQKWNVRLAITPREEK